MDRPLPESRLYQIGSRLRPMPFLLPDGTEYERRRFRFGPQRVVHARERAIVREALKYLHVSLDGDPSAPRARLLDVPSGYGRLMRDLSRYRARAFGLDLSLPHARRSGTVGPSVAGNLLSGLPFRDDTFDLVLCVRLLHHLPTPADRAAAVAELARVSRGHVLLSYYAPSPLWRTHRRLLERLALKKPRVALVPRRELVRLAARSSFSLEAEWSVVPLLHAHRFALLRKER